MSDSGEVEVETSGYQVLPKEVTDEIGSIKLFNKWYVEKGRGEDGIGGAFANYISNTGPTRMSKSAISL
jgi:small subunit ribosomal protein S5e